MTTSLIGPAKPPALHVMSYNLRYAGTRDDPWPPRRPVVAALLDAERPTVLGTQEGLYGQLREVESDLPAAYRWIGTGREGGSRGEFAAIFYDHDRLEPLEFDHVWLSDTPREIGSRTWGNTCVRMMTWVRFRDREAGRELLVANTHLDHAVQRAQDEGAKLIRKELEAASGTEEAELPVVLTGDFNVAAGDSTPYDTLTAGGWLRDTWLVAGDQATPECSTYHGYGAPAPGARIDWILAGAGGINVRTAAINTFAPDGAFGSDHFPVQAVVELP